MKVDAPPLSGRGWGMYGLGPAPVGAGDVKPGWLHRYLSCSRSPVGEVVWVIVRLSPDWLRVSLRHGQPY